MTPENTTVASRILLAFADSHGAIQRFSLPRARADKPVTEIQSGMAAMVASQALSLARIGEVAAGKGATLITTTRHTLFNQGGN